MSLETTFNPLRVLDVRRETPHAVTIRFETPAALAELYRFQPGQHLTLSLELDGEEHRRNYSICASPLEAELRIAVKQVTGGRVSTWANSQLAKGDIVSIMPPLGGFTWRFQAGARRRYLGVAAGSGITPVLSLLKTALAVETESRFTLFYGNRGVGSVMFLDELADLKNRHMERLDVYHFLSEESEDIDIFNGRLDRTRCDAALEAFVDVSALDAAFVCGPAAMMEDVTAALQARGLAADKILAERFASSPITQAQADAATALARQAAGRRISVILDGRRAQVTYDAEKISILESVRAAGLPAPYACKGGVCATCRAKVTRGSVEMRVNYGLTAEEVEQGYVLTCQAIPMSDDVVVNYDG